MAAVSSCSLDYSSLVRLKKSTESLVDLTYFMQWLPLPILNHRLMQGYTMRKWELLQEQIDFPPPSRIITIQASETEAELFKLLLRQSDKVKGVFIEKGLLTIQLNRGFCKAPLSRKFSEEKDSFVSIESEERKIHSKQISSHSIHFPAPNTAHYINAYETTLQEIYRALEENNSQINIYLYGIDCLFFRFMLQELYSSCLEEVLLRPNYALRLFIKKISPAKRKEIADDLRAAMKHEETSENSCAFIKTVHFEADKISESSLKKAVSSKFCEHKEKIAKDSSHQLSPRKSSSVFSSAKETPETNQTSAKIVHFISKRTLSKESKKLPPLKISSILSSNENFSEATPRSTYFTTSSQISQNFSGKLPSPKRSFISPSAALALFCHPLDHGSDSEEQLNNNAYCLASTYLAYRLGQIPSKIKPKEEDWENLWHEIDTCLPKSPLYKNLKKQKEIQSLALLKSSLEQRSFAPIEAANPEQLQKTNLYQIVRGLFPHENSTSIVPVWIDRNLLTEDMSKEEEGDPPLIYFLKLLRSLTQSQRFFNADYTALAVSLRFLKENEELNVDNPEQKKLLLMLQAASFSFFSHAERTVVERITKNLQETHEEEIENYKIKITTPHNASCEFFTPSPGDFTTIRTHTFRILRNEIEKGKFVVKWKVSLSKEQWSFSIQIPSIDLNHTCSPKEQRVIYEGFEQEKIVD